MKGLLISNGELKDINLLRELSREVDFVLAADGGTNHCMKANIIPDLIIGDLDSIDDKVLNKVNRLNIPIAKYPPKKNATDTEICLDYFIEKEYDEVILLGSLGSRMDHSLANIYLLEFLMDKGVQGKLVDENNIIYLVEGRHEFVGKKKYLSVIPISDDGIEVSLDGLEYPLDHKLIERGSSLGISNEFKSNLGIVNIHRGRALIIISDD